MSLDTKQQVYDIISTSQSILIVTNKELDGDSLGSAFAVFYILKKMEKNPQIVLSASPPEKYKFIPWPEYSLKEIPCSPSGLTLCINKARENVKEVYYEKLGEKLKIFVTGNGGNFSPEDITIENSQSWDLIISLNSPDLESLGDIFLKNSDLFYQTPILNIDWKASNENFGRINLVELTASSACEIIADLLKSNFSDFLNKEAATSLLLGMVESTKNFQNKLASPKTFTLASWLMENGADHQTIIRHLYKTRALGELQLFGRVLARIKKLENSDFSLVALPYQDFTLTNTEVPQLSSVLKEFKENFSHLNPLILLWENQAKETWGVVLCKEEQRLESLRKKIGGLVKEEKLFFRFDETSLKEAEAEIIHFVIQGNGPN